MTTMSIEITRTGETITLGRRDYGWGVTAELVEVDGEVFAQHGGAYYTECWDCHVRWSGSKPVFAHVLDAVCFRCNGKGWGRRYESAEDIVRIAKRRRADEARRIRKAQEREAAQRAEHAVWVAAHADLAAELAAIYAELPEGMHTDADYDQQQAAHAKWGEMVVSIASQAQFKPLSDKQVEAVVAGIADAKARQEAKAAKLAAARYAGEVGAKVTVTGVVKTAMVVDGYMPGSSEMLVIVEGTGSDEGVTIKVKGTGKTLWDAERGQEVTVTGTVKRHGEYKGTPQTEVTRAKITAL